MGLALAATQSTNKKTKTCHTRWETSLRTLSSRLSSMCPDPVHITLVRKETLLRQSSAVMCAELSGVILCRQDLEPTSKNLHEALRRVHQAMASGLRHANQIESLKFRALAIIHQVASALDSNHLTQWDLFLITLLRKKSNLINLDPATIRQALVRL